MKFSVSVIGATVLADAIDGIADKLGGKEGDKALLKGAKVIEEFAKENVERMGAVDTGFLRESVYSATEKESGYDAARSAASVRNRQARMESEVKPDDGEAVVVAGAEHAKYVEHGTGRMAARPFMRQAIDKGRKKATKAVADGVSDIVRKELR